MKTPPPISYPPPGGSPAERLDMAFRKVLTVPKETILQEEEHERRARSRRKASKTKPH
jgi:hypothetical protein